MKLRQTRNAARRLSAGAMAGVCCALSLVSPALAGPPEISTDEALYVNLDYYGTPTAASVVKGCSLNGIREFTDYGVYTDVTNMSNYAVPAIDGDAVTWTLPQDAKERFYYECQLETGAVEIPWTFDISYRLNGVPAEAEDLAGASGLVETDIHCIPNPRAREYYQNNMLLLAAALVNMEDVTSILAPGSQTQALGTYKAVIFAAVPGEETTFHLEIGTTDYGSMGIIFLMTPGTLEQMSEIKDIRKVKDTFSDSTEELVDSLNEILEKLDRVTGSLDTTREGLAELKAAKQNLDASKDAVSNSLANSLDELDALTARLNEAAPDINAGKETLEQVNDDLNRMVSTLNASSTEVERLTDDLGKISSQLRALKNAYDNADTARFEEILSQAGDHLTALEESLDELEGLLGYLDGIEEGDLLPEEIEGSLEEIRDATASVQDQFASVIGEDQAKALVGSLSDIDPAGLADNYNRLNRILEKYRQMLQDARSLVDRLRSLIDNPDISGALKNGSGLADSAGDTVSYLESLIWDVDNLNSTVNENKASLELTLDNAAATADQLSRTTSALSQSLRLIQDTLKSNRETLENSTDEILDGLIDVLDQASSSTASSSLQDANSAIKDSVKEELDEITGETNLLNLDTEEAPVSFTSDKNPSPASIQIILRSQEISHQDQEDNAVDIEPQEEPVGLWQRIVNVFKKIWDAICSVFS